MKLKFYNKISFKLLLLTIISVLVSFLVLSIATEVFSEVFFDYFVEYKNDILDDDNVEDFVSIYGFYIFIVALIPILSFIVIFLIGISKKVRYIGEIEKSVGEIDYENKYYPLKLKGNDEISLLAKNINDMNFRIRKSYLKEKTLEQNKSDLIMAMSHDLKTPLTSIIGYLELLNKNSLDYPENDKEYLKIAYEKSISLSKLINQLFEYTKVNNNSLKLEKTPHNISILISQIIGEYEHLFANKGINVNLNSSSNELWGSIDLQHFIRIIENILKNAEKYSYENSNFNIDVEKINDSIMMSFENESDTISKENLQNIFLEMYRLDKARSSDNEGSGLGLAIAKKIVELHNGKIWAESNDNKVKIFIVFPILNN